MSSDYTTFRYWWRWGRRTDKLCRVLCALSSTSNIICIVKRKRKRKAHCVEAREGKSRSQAVWRPNCHTNRSSYPKSPRRETPRKYLRLEVYLFSVRRKHHRIAKTAISPFSIYIAPRSSYIPPQVYPACEAKSTDRSSMCRYESEENEREEIRRRESEPSCGALPPPAWNWGTQEEGEECDTETKGEHAKSSFHLSELLIFDRRSTWLRERKQIIRSSPDESLFNIHPPYIAQLVFIDRHVQSVLGAIAFLVIRGCLWRFRIRFPSSEIRWDAIFFTIF